MLKAMREDGVPHPAEKSQPALRGDCIEYHGVFRLLGARRLWNELGPQPIASSEIDRKLMFLGYQGEELFKASRFIAMQDDIELQAFYAKRKTESK